MKRSRLLILALLILSLLLVGCASAVDSATGDSSDCTQDAIHPALSASAASMLSPERSLPTESEYGSVEEIVQSADVSEIVSAIKEAKPDAADEPIETESPVALLPEEPISDSESVLQGEARELPNTSASTQSVMASQENCNYIGNYNTLKFHYPSCGSVRQMKEENKYYFIGSREDLIMQGYVPCQKCNP